MAKITRNIHSLEGLKHPLGIEIAPCVVEEDGPHDLTLVDSCFLAEFPKLEAKMRDEGYDLRDVRRLVLTHNHPDHVQAANKVREVSGAKILSHWIEAAYLRESPPYNGPPSHDTVLRMMRKLGIRPEDVRDRFGSLVVDPILVDSAVSEGERIGRLRVVHSPGHTSGHIALYSEEDRTLIGGDFLFKGVLGEEGLFVPPSDFTIDPVLAAVSARRIAQQLQFDRLLLGHQDAPVLEQASALVERTAEDAVKKASMMKKK